MCEKSVVQLYQKIRSTTSSQRNIEYVVLEDRVNQTQNPCGLRGYHPMATEAEGTGIQFID